jgi:hypothetical protein
VRRSILRWGFGLGVLRGGMLGVASGRCVVVLFLVEELG